MPVPDYETLMLPVLRAFNDGARSVSECLPLLREEFRLTDDEAEELLPSGRITVLASRAHWARTYMAKAGLLRSPQRNRHEITERGRQVIARNPERLDNATLRRWFSDFDEWLSAARNRTAAPTEAGDGFPEHPTGRGEPLQTPDETIERAHSEAEAALAEDLLGLLYQMDATRFERLVLDLLTAMGYGTGTFGARSLTPGSGDGGIDGIIHEDALGLDAVYVQAKRYQPETRVGRPAIQQFVGSLTGEGATKGVFVTTSSFSSEAKEYLRRVSHRIVLIDGPELARRMIRHGVGVRVRRVLELKGIDADYFDDAG
jgi:restriction system protein